MVNFAFLSGLLQPYMANIAQTVITGLGSDKFILK